MAKVDNGTQSEDVNSMKREAQTFRVVPNPRRRKNRVLAEVTPISGGTQSAWDRCRVLDLIVKEKQPIYESELTPLNTDQSHVIAMMTEHHLGRAPPKMGGKKETKKANLFCAYYRNIGHKIENYNDLKKKIENLIKQWHLK